MNKKSREFPTTSLHFSLYRTFFTCRELFFQLHFNKLSVLSLFLLFYFNIFSLFFFVSPLWWPTGNTASLLNPPRLVQTPNPSQDRLKNLLKKPTLGQAETTTPGQIFNRGEGRVDWRKWEYRERKKKKRKRGKEIVKKKNT